MRNNILLIVLAQLLIVSLTIGLDEDLEEGSACKLEDGGPGVCKKLPDCPQKLKEVIEGRRNWHATGRCGFVGFIEIVCCPSKANFTDKISQRPAEAACSEYDNNLAYHIFDGIEAKAGEFPYVVALGYVNDNSAEDGQPIRYGCGGSLISTEHVLTAAHCVHNINKNVPIEVRLGHEDVTSIDESVQRIPISDIMYHPEYKISINYYDVAILKLKRKVNMTGTVRPICLQTKPLESITITPKTSLIVLGWGATSYEQDRSNKLMRTPNLSLVDKEECGKLYNGLRQLPRGLDDTIICAIDRNVSRRSDACQGDSGGPLLMISEDGDRVLGITAFGQSCGSSIPGVYISVHSFLDWIEEHVWTPPATTNKDKLSLSFTLTIKSAPGPEE
ncbi:serine protease persephone [Lasioglossum baleicum]|uniref:serine protease persephone n=1 Tax=Lasioglossum baleicum TaxID=434251 RepID=UPI003FCD0666